MRLVYESADINGLHEEAQSAACRCVESPVGGRKSPNSSDIWNLLFQALSPRKWAVGIATKGWWARACKSVCVRDWGAANRRPRCKHSWREEGYMTGTGERLANTHVYIYTHTQSEAGRFWGSPWPVILSCVYLPQDQCTHLSLSLSGVNAKSPGWRETPNTEPYTPPSPYIFSHQHKHKIMQ